MINKYYAKLLNPFGKGKDIYVKYVIHTSILFFNYLKYYSFLA